MRNTTLLPLAAALALTGCATFVPDPATPPAADPTPAEAIPAPAADPTPTPPTEATPTHTATDFIPVAQPTPAVGAYSDYTVLDPEKRDVFTAATRGTKAQNLRPVAVATQVVNGLNYDFRCKSEDGRYRYSVIIHRPLPKSGEPSRLISITELPPAE